MLGTVVNCGTIILGCIVGLVVKGRLKRKS